MNSCIDIYEASIVRVDDREIAVSKKGKIPASKTSFIQADSACRNAGKRLCTLKEWDMSCKGKENRIYPYGNRFVEEACNGVYLYDDPRQSAPVATGSMPGCKTPEGVYDLSGNVWEWVNERDQTGTLRLMRGGGYSNRDYLLKCESVEPAFQPMDEPFGGVGFRCCKDIEN